MQRNNANTSPCRCCGRRLPDKRVRVYCSRPCAATGAALLRSRGRPQIVLIQARKHRGGRR